MQIYIKGLFKKEIYNLNESIKNNDRILIHKLIDKVKDGEDIDTNDIDVYIWFREKCQLQKERLENYLKNNGDFYKID